MKRTQQVFALLTLVLAVTAAGPAGRDQVRAGEWPVYGGDNANSKYSPLAQIDAGNVRHLQIAWSWTSPDEAVLSANPSLKTFIHEATPLMVDGVLYIAMLAASC